MKKVMICLLMVLAVAGQGLAQSLPQKFRKAGIVRYGAPTTSPDNSVNTLPNRTTRAKAASSRPSTQPEYQPRPSSPAIPTSSARAVVEKGPVLPPQADRPFDGNTATVNPFAAPSPWPGSPLNAAVPLQSSANPFKPVVPPINPFQGGTSNPPPFTRTVPGLSPPAAQGNLEPRPPGNPIPFNPAGSVWNSNWSIPHENPSSFDNPLRGTSPGVKQPTGGY